MRTIPVIQVVTLVVLTGCAPKVQPVLVAPHPDAFPHNWLGYKISFEIAEKNILIIDKHLSANQKWIKFKANFATGDELWHWTSPINTDLLSLEGYCQIRNNRILNIYTRGKTVVLACP